MISKKCLERILEQRYPEVGRELAEEFWRRGGTSKQGLENLPRTYSSPIAFGVSIYEAIHLILTTIEATGCQDDAPGPPMPVARTYENILPSAAPVRTVRPRKATKEIDDDNSV